MAIQDYDTLAAAIRTWCARSQDQTFNNEIPTFVQLAEDRIYNGVGEDNDPLFSPPVRVSEMSRVVELDVDDGRVAVPADSLGMRRLSRPNDRVGLEYLSPDAFARRLAVADGGLPRYYTVEGPDIRVAPGGWKGKLDLLYYARPQAIDTTNPTNAMLTAYPMLYLASALFEAFSFMRNGDAASSWLSKYRSQCTGVNKTASKSRHGGGKIRTQLRTPIP